MDLALLMVISLILVFIVMASQFESFAMPFVIMFSIPFAFTGVVLALFITNTTLSLVAGLGAVLLIGIVVKNGIILIDYTDILRNEGKTLKDAVIEGGATRLNPVILTAASTILGLIPLAIGLNIDFYGLFASFDPNIYFGGDNASFWGPLAWTIIFGLSTCTRSSRIRLDTCS